MQSFLSKIKSLLVKRKHYDSEIISDVKMNADGTPYFIVMLSGCKSAINISAEEIIENFINKFSQTDIKKATKAYMKNRNFFTLLTIENNYVIFFNKIEKKFELIDLSQSSCIKNIDIDSLDPSDAFKLGAQFGKIQIEKDRKLFNLKKTSVTPVSLKLVK